MSENEALRYRRLAFYSEDIDRFNSAMKAFIHKANAHQVLLIDRDGHLIAKQGHSSGSDGATMAALVAGSFASTCEVAKLLGDQQFTTLFHQGHNQSIDIRLVGARCLQISVFDKTVKAGMIGVFARELADRLEGIVTEIQQRENEPDQPDRPGLADNFSDEMKSHLDDLFGGL
ncbi:MAG: roadblock/LC7 domain-containing protein [Planctomycetota bacterium]